MIQINKEVVYSDISTLPKLLRLKELKQYLKIGNEKALILLNRKDFPSFRLGKSWYIQEDRLIEWIEKQTKKSRY